MKNELLKLARFVKNCIEPVKIFFKYKYAGYPKVLQLPITYMCNFDCVMCGMRKIKQKDFTTDELKKILKSKLFKNITAVGVNGGEPFMKNDLPDYIQVLLETLPKLKSIHLITNGYFTDKIEKILPKIKSACDCKRVKLNIAVSTDAIGKKQNFHRGKECAKQIEKTIDFLLSNGGRKNYDNMITICTITKHNVYDLPEVEVWAEEKGVKVNYDIATYHERIRNAEKFEDFTLFNDELARQVAEEFFYKKYLETYSAKYFNLCYYIRNKKRISPCSYQCNIGVTLTPNKQLAYCATYSKELGDAFLTDANELYRHNISYRNALIKEKCSSCSHYMESNNIIGFIIYFKEFFKNRCFFH